MKSCWEEWWSLVKMDVCYLFTCIIATCVVTSRGIAVKGPTNHPFTNKDAALLFGTDNLDDVPDYELINLDNLIKHQKNGGKGDSCFTAFDKPLCVRFIPNKVLGGGTHTVEHHHANGSVSRYTNVLREYNLGVVNNDTRSHSAFHHCGRGLTGHIKLVNDLYIVNPLPPNLHSDRSNHVIYRRRRSTTLQMLQSDIDGLKKVESEIEHAIKKRESKVTTQREKYMELMIAVDYTMVKFYHPDVLPGYLVAMANIIYGFFADSSLVYPITVALVKIVYFEEDKFKATTMYDLDSKFRNWCVENYVANDTDVDHWDTAMMLTRDGCADGCGLEGLASNAMCSSKTTSVFKDKGLMSAMTAAHEIAHNFNVLHDGDHNHCQNSINLMASGAVFGHEKEQWSNCTSVVIEKAMKSPNSACFNDKPPDKAQIKYRLYGNQYNRSRQCKFMLGDEYISCGGMAHRCDDLFCSKKTEIGVCVDKSYPPADGTHCGPHMWCIHDICVPDGSTPPPPVNGGWSTWGPYTSCNKDCGIGVMWKERKCNTPSKQHGGLPCKGEEKGHHKTCNTQKCVGKKPSGSALEQCQKLRSTYTNYLDYAPHPCRLYCGYLGGYTYVQLGRKADGTTCGGYTSNSICINRKCTEVGCDLVLNSGAVHDRCGVCGGDGTSCQWYTGKDMTGYTNKGGWHHRIVSIPAGSLNITVEQMEPTYLGFLGFTVSDPNGHYAIGLPPVWKYYGYKYDLDGTAIKYWCSAWTYADKLQAIGKIDKPIFIWYYAYYGWWSKSKGIAWRYLGALNTTTPVPPSFKWFGKEWTTCTVTCAGGTQERKVVCLRTDDDSQVNTASCSSLAKIPSVQSCNSQDCPPVWHVTEWSTCTKTCGKGVKTRDILCSVKYNGATRKTVSENLCTDDKPGVKISDNCNAVMCYAKWNILTEFGKCTVSCGGGIKERTVVCQHVSANGELHKTHANECINQKKPVDKAPCNQQACN